MSRLGPIMQAVLDQAAEALTPPGQDGYPIEAAPPGRIYLSPGDTVAWDDCCNGQLWVRLLPVTAPRDSSNPRRGPGGVCGPHMWSVRLGIGVLRCAAVVDDRGRAPAPSALTDDTLGMVEDMEILQHALQNLDLPRAALSVTLTEWTPLGPSGQCVGGEWILALSVANCG